MPQLEPAADLFVTWANRSCALQAMDTQQLQLCILDKQCEVASLAQEVQERRCHSAMLKLRLVSCEETIFDLQANSVQLFKRFKDACISHQRSQGHLLAAEQRSQAREEELASLQQQLHEASASQQLLQARLAIAVAAAQEGEEKAGGALQEAKGQSEAALGRAIALEAECAQLQRQAADLAASLKASQADGAAREAELESESERRSALDLELARTQEALDESKMLHQALQQQHTASQDTTQAETQRAEDTQLQLKAAKEKLKLVEQQLQGVEAKATLAEQRLAQRIATGQAELDAATERAQLQAGLAEERVKSAEERARMMEAGLRDQLSMLRSGIEAERQARQRAEQELQKGQDLFHQGSCRAREQLVSLQNQVEAQERRLRLNQASLQGSRHASQSPVHLAEAALGTVDGVSPSGSRTSTRLRKQASAWWQGEPGASGATPEVPVQLTHPDEGSEALHLEVAMQDASTAGKGSEAEAMPAGPDCKDGRRSRRGGSQVVKDTITEGDESSLQDTDSGHAAAMPETAEDDSPAHGPTSAEKRRKGKGSRGGKKRAAPEGKGRAGGDGASQEEAGKPAKRTRRQTAAAQAKASSIDESLQPCDVFSPTDDAAASDPTTDDPAAAGDTALGMGEDDAQAEVAFASSTQPPHASQEEAIQPRSKSVPSSAAKRPLTIPLDAAWAGVGDLCDAAAGKSPGAAPAQKAEGEVERKPLIALNPRVLAAAAQFRAPSGTHLPRDSLVGEPTKGRRMSIKPNGRRGLLGRLTQSGHHDKITPNTLLQGFHIPRLNKG
ncbi:hypothetical protein WJX84_011814 [Apatococcus fuscideae]|uniref:Uncharacterized protein n=1 Tax=Apatococcus fuscideae TaxID=2026836 RepID=A0AAW1STD5_9CHLO